MKKKMMMMMKKEKTSGWNHEILSNEAFPRTAIHSKLLLHSARGTKTLSSPYESIYQKMKNRK